MIIFRFLFCPVLACIAFLPVGSIYARTGEQVMKVGVGAGFAVGLYGERVPEDLDRGYISLNLLEAFVRPEIDVNLDNGYIISLKTKISAVMDYETYTLSLLLKDTFLSLEGPFGRIQIGAVKSVNNKLHVSTPWASPFSGVDYGYYYVTGSSLRNLILVPDDRITNIPTANTNLLKINEVFQYSTYPDLTGRSIKLNIYTPRFSFADFFGIAMAMSYTPNADDIRNVLGGNITIDGEYDLADVMGMSDMKEMLCPDSMISYRFSGGYEVSLALPLDINHTNQVGDTGVYVSACGLTLGGGFKYKINNEAPPLSGNREDPDETIIWSLGFSYGRDEWKAGFGFLQSRYVSGDNISSVKSVYDDNPTPPSRERNNVDFTASYELSYGLSITANIQYIWYAENSVRVADAVGAGVILGFLY